MSMKGSAGAPARSTRVVVATLMEQLIHAEEPCNSSQHATAQRQTGFPHGPDPRF